MDTRRLVIGMILAMAVVFGWQFLVAYIYKQHPEWRPQPAQVETATTEPTVDPATRSTTAPAPVEQAPLPSTIAASGSLRPIPPSTKASVVTLGTAHGFPLALEILPRGASIAQATLKKYKAPDGTGDYVFQTPPGHASGRHALATRAVVINGQTIDISDAVWTVSRSDDRSVELTLDLAAGDDAKPTARLRKRFILTDASDPSEGFIVNVEQTIENLGSSPLVARLNFDGPTVPPRELSSGPDLQIVAGYDDERIIAAEAYYTSTFVDEDVKRNLLTPDEEGHVFVWAGAASVYFNALIRPLPQEGVESGGVPVAKYLQSAQAEALKPSSAADHRDLVLNFETKDFNVAPGQPLTLGLELYLGPKQRSILNSDFYSEYPRSYDSTLVIRSGPCGFCTFNWLINALVMLLGFFHYVFGGFAGHGDWGLAIIALVVLVRSMLHPITKRSQVSMMKMGKMGPEIEKLKKKYGDDKDSLNKAMMEVYKTQGATPILGCLPMFLQMPIWIALWASLQSTFELRQAPFLWGFTWIDDLAKPDLLIDFGRDIPLFFGLHLGGVNLLPILMGFVFFLQQKLTPKPPAMNEQQEQQQKMMQWMSLLFPIFLYNGPSGLNLYILTSTAIGIVESKIVRKHIKEQEEREKAGPVIVDAPFESKKPREDDRVGVKKSKAGQKGLTKPATGLAGWLARLQEKADEVRREAERKGRK